MEDMAISELSKINRFLRESNETISDEIMKECFIKLCPELQILCNGNNRITVVVPDVLNVDEFKTRYNHVLAYLIMQHSSMMDMEYDYIPYMYSILLHNNNENDTTLKIRLKPPM